MCFYVTGSLIKSLFMGAVFYLGLFYECVHTVLLDGYLISCPARRQEMKLKGAQKGWDPGVVSSRASRAKRRLCPLAVGGTGHTQAQGMGSGLCPRPMGASAHLLPGRQWCLCASHGLWQSRLGQFCVISEGPASLDLLLHQVLPVSSGAIGKSHLTAVAGSGMSRGRAAWLHLRCGRLCAQQGVSHAGCTPQT